jgi:3-phosphoshikimate 1-carboxyvinyltransferase
VKLIVNKTKELTGDIGIPGSKSHTVRAVVIASLAEGISKITNPLKSADTIAAADACSALGAEIEIKDDAWFVRGFAGKPKQPDGVIDFANSGASSRLIMSVIALGGVNAIIDGDNSLRKRPMQPLIDALSNLGVSARSSDGNGCLPIEISGKLVGGTTEVDCRSSQYVSSLLISCPLAEKDTVITVKNICEKPYIEMTLGWLDEQGIEYENDKLESFRIRGDQRYDAFEKKVPGDWSSATFPLCAGAITKSDILLMGLDMEDTQGDKEIVSMLREMGADITVEENGIRIKGGKELHGAELDLSNTPDALPALTVVGCLAKGTTKLVNVVQARIKETDRVKVITQELSKMGANIEELEDGIIIRESDLKGANVSGHNDHRIVMALSLAGMIADGETEIDTAESVDVTYPGYVESMRSVNADMRLVE